MQCSSGLLENYTLIHFASVSSIVKQYKSIRSFSLETVYTESLKIFHQLDETRIWRVRYLGNIWSDQSQNYWYKQCLTKRIWVMGGSSAPVHTQIPHANKLAVDLTLSYTYHMEHWKIVNLITVSVRQNWLTLAKVMYMLLV